MKCLLCQSDVQISESFHIPWFPFGTEHPLFELAGTTVHRKCMEQNPEVRSLVELLIKRVPWVCTICHGKLDPWFEQSVVETAKVPQVMKNRIRFGELELVCVPSQIALPNFPSNEIEQCFHFTCLEGAAAVEELAGRCPGLSAIGYSGQQIEFFKRYVRKEGLFGGISGKMTNLERQQELSALIRSGIPPVGGTYPFL